MKKVEDTKGQSRLEKAIEKLRDQYGVGAILTKDNTPEKVEAIPTGCFVLDDILGCGGLPRGRILEVYGSESSGKTSLTLFLAAQLQKQGKTVAFIDVENAFDRKYASSIGVDVDKLLVSQAETLEETMDIIRALAETNEVDLIIVDSVAALTPKAELEGEEMLKDTMALMARLLGKSLRILGGPIARSKTVCIFINQLRDKIGVFYGEKSATPGGRAIKFWSSVRLSVTKGDKIKGPKDEAIGVQLKITAVKNKVAIPWKTGGIELIFGSGINLEKDALITGVDKGIIIRTGNNYTYGEAKLGVGEKQAVETLKKNPELFEELKKEIKNKL